MEGRSAGEPSERLSGPHSFADGADVDRLLLKAVARALGVRRPNPTPRLCDWQIKKVRRYVEHHLDETVSVVELAAIARLSTSHFRRAFKGSLGVTPHSYVAGRRVQRAQELLRSSSDSLSSIALHCGMFDQSHFNRVFRRHTGLPPGKWRQLPVTPVETAPGQRIRTPHSAVIGS